MPFFKDSCLQKKVNLPKALLRCRDVRPTVEPYSRLASKLVDLHIYKHPQHFMNRHGKLAALELALELTK